MKIGILTFHYTINQGSVIQAYCVENLLKDQFPNATVEIINLVPLIREKYELRFYKKKFPFINFQRIHKYISIRKFVHGHLNLSPKVYYNSIDKQINYINKQNYDIICTGSDTVWVNSFKLKNHVPNIYFLPTQLNAKKISVAASADPLLNEDIYTRKIEEMFSIFNAYELITVRDDATQNLISKFTSKQVEVIADPTILFDFEKKLGFINGSKEKPFGKKNIGIGITDIRLKKLLNRELSCQYNIVDMYNSKSMYFDYIFDEINSYSKYDIIITDRFHRSIFSLKFANALVINVERSNKNKTENSKGRDLFNRIGLAEHFIRWEEGENELFMKRLLNILDSWDEKSLVTRNEKVQSYIMEEKEHWKSLVNSMGF